MALISYLKNIFGVFLHKLLIRIGFYFNMKRTLMYSVVKKRVGIIIKYKEFIYIR